MLYTATAKYVRLSPRKVRLVSRAISGKRVDAALSSLSILSKAAAEPIRNVVESAGSGAKQKKANIATLVISTIDVMGGPVMKRWHAVSRGTAHSYKKRMTHIKVVLSDTLQEGTIRA